MLKYKISIYLGVALSYTLYKVNISYGVFCIFWRKDEAVKEMKKISRIALGCLLLCLFFAACTKEDPKEKEKDVPAESWAYNHEPEKEILRLREDGTALFKGTEYSYSKDDQFITMTDDKNQSLKLRYKMTKEGMYLYEQTTYHFNGEGEPEGLLGVWVGGPEDRLSYEFTSSGTFREDGYFPGHYLADPEAGTIKLMYNDHFEDTYIYYTLNGKELFVEYPWPLVTTVTEAK